MKLGTLIFLIIAGFIIVMIIGYSRDIRSRAAGSCGNNPYCTYGLIPAKDGGFSDRDGVIYYQDGKVLMPSGDMVGPGTHAIGFQDAKGNYHVISDPTEMDAKVYQLKKPIRAICDVEQNCRSCRRYESAVCGQQMTHVPFGTGQYRLIASTNYQYCSSDTIACNYIAQPVTNDAIYGTDLVVDQGFDCSSLKACFASVLDRIIFILTGK